MTVKALYKYTVETTYPIDIEGGATTGYLAFDINAPSFNEAVSIANQIVEAHDCEGMSIWSISEIDEDE